MKTTTFNFSIPRWTMAEELGYKPITTFWMDFSIADKFGPAAVIDTFKRAFAEWKSNYKYLTELVMVLNHKIAYHYRPDKDTRDKANALANLYNALWVKADSYACENLKGDEYSYYFRITD